MQKLIGFCVIILSFTTAEARNSQTLKKYIHGLDSESDLIPKDKFFYFAYGSNLLKSRLLIQNPSAKFYNKAKLTGYRLDFNMTLGFWNGAVATIARDPARDVWGALWVMDKAYVGDLDNQEGVDQGWYYPLYVTVTTPDHKSVVARTYKEFVDPPPMHQSQIEAQRRPSNTYLQVILNGAIDCKLPASYIEWLYKFKTNGQHADLYLIKKLGYPFFTITTDDAPSS